MRRTSYNPHKRKTDKEIILSQDHYEVFNAIVAARIEQHDLIPDDRDLEIVDDLVTVGLLEGTKETKYHPDGQQYTELVLTMTEDGGDFFKAINIKKSKQKNKK